MGVGPSSQQTNLHGVDYVKHEINNIASQYANGVLKGDRSSLLDPTKCNKLVVLGQDAISKLFDRTIIEGDTPHSVMISDTDRLLSGVERRQSTSHQYDWYGRRIPSSYKEQIYIKREKKKDCVDLAEQYVKLFHLIAAIRYALVDDIDISNFSNLSSSIANPDGYGKGYDVERIKKRVMTKSIQPKLRNMCSNRLKELRELIEHTGAVPIDIKPMGNLKSSQTLTHLPDLLSVLYPTSYKDGRFAEPSSKQIEQSVVFFSRIYHGDKYDRMVGTNPPKTFGEIQLNDYSDTKMNDSFTSISDDDALRHLGEKDNDEAWKQSLRAYAKHLKQAEESHVKSALELLSLVDSFFFTESKDNKQIKETMMSRATINSALNSARLIIITMEATCEKNFKKTLELYKRLGELKRLFAEQQRADANVGLLSN